MPPFNITTTTQNYADSSIDINAVSFWNGNSDLKNKKINFLSNYLKNVPDALKTTQLYDNKIHIRDIWSFYVIDETSKVGVFVNSTNMLDNIPFEEFISQIRLGYIVCEIKPSQGILKIRNEGDLDYSGLFIVGQLPENSVLSGGNSVIYYSIKDNASINEIRCFGFNSHTSVQLNSDFNNLTTQEKVVMIKEVIKNSFNYLRNSYMQRQFNRVSINASGEQILNRRPNTKTTRFRATKHGNYVKHNVPFAVELECYGKNSETVAKMSRALDLSWGVARDGSLGSDIGYPIEIQSPILSGVKGEKLIIDTCDIINSLGFKTDKTCGMHVHLGCGNSFVKTPRVLANKERPSNLISLYLFHRLFEDVIVSFLPTTRRVNNYCGQFKNGVEYRGSRLEHNTIDMVFDIMQNIKTLNQFELFWYRARDARHVSNIKNERYTITRYMGINFHSLLKDNHIEVRYHSGTLNYEKILYWVNLHGKIVELCASGVINERLLIDIKNRNLSLQQMTQELFKLLKLDNDTVEYLLDRQERFKNADTESIDEIAIDKTKKIGVV